MWGRLTSACSYCSFLDYHDYCITFMDAISCAIWLFYLQKVKVLFELNNFLMVVRAQIFASIPLGKALVLTQEEGSPSTIRTALKRNQRRGRFKRLYLTTRKQEDGKYLSYIVNPTSEETWLRNGRRMSTRALSSILFQCFMISSKSESSKLRKRTFLPSIILETTKL